MGHVRANKASTTGGWRMRLRAVMLSSLRSRIGRNQFHVWRDHPVDCGQKVHDQEGLAKDARDAELLGPFEILRPRPVEQEHDRRTRWHAWLICRQ